MKKMYTFNSPVGYLTAELNEEGNALSALLFENLGGTDKHPLLLQAQSQLDEYFMGKRTDFSIPLSPSGTPFQLRVWNQLQKIPYGMTVSYGEIAAAIDKPGGARAVGMANHRNPLPIFIPCHRVIGADGSLIGYGGGLSIKTFLLNLEKGIRHP